MHISPSLFPRVGGKRLLLVVPLPELDGAGVGGDEDGAPQEGAEWGVEQSGEESLEQQHGRIWAGP